MSEICGYKLLSPDATGEGSDLVSGKNAEDGLRRIMRFLAEEVSRHTYVNIMGQYHPAGRVSDKRFGEINRRPFQAEIRATFDAARAAGLYRFDSRQPLFGSLPPV